MPTNFAPGAQGTRQLGPRYNIIATNVGGAAATGPIVVTDTLPSGLTATDLEGSGCAAIGQVVTCTTSEAVLSGASLALEIAVDVGQLADPTVLGQNEVTIESPGAATATTTTTTTVSAEPAPFALLSEGAGLGASLSGVTGSPVGAGAHPDQLTIDVGFRTNPGSHEPASTTILPAGDGVRDSRVSLPPGLVIDPTATPVRCTEAQFEIKACPNDSALGLAGVLYSFAGISSYTTQPLYNLEPPPGSAASFGFNPEGDGLYIHVLGGLRAGDYRLTGTAEDLPSLFSHVAYQALLQFWGDPSSSSHDHTRGRCHSQEETCSIPSMDIPALSTPTSCSSSLPLEAEVDSWEGPGDFLDAGASFTELDGTQTQVSGCDAVPFKPSLSVQPTTDLADSPTGLDLDLHLPQSASLKTTATGHLKAATVTLPEGLVVNLASARGLAACDPDQIGIDLQTGVADGSPAHCPDASKIGTVEVDTPMLARYDSQNRILRDPQGHAIPEPVKGSLYVASPYENPFDSLLAVYLALEDPERGIVVKLAGEVQADAQTGRLAATFANNPQLPFEDLKLHLFGGTRTALKTSLSCGTKTATSELTPWSDPQGASATPSDSFQTTVEPGGGSCPGDDAGAANRPSFVAGTIEPTAGAYSPFVLKLSREDGTAPIAAIETTLPAGLTGRLAGATPCSDGTLAAAAAATNGGAAEQGHPCPGSSKLGSVDVGLGAGPAPYYVEGDIYLSGPYKGAPLSLAMVTPATAGPYDLGTVVVRAAVYVDPETARARVVSDPLPQVLGGIPLDVRSISLQFDRPKFTLNPTSCNPMTLIGSATSPSGSTALLSNRFQVGGCPTLPFKPTLSVGLKGGTKRGQHPALSASFDAQPGEADIAKLSIVLPRSQFVEPSHIKAICTEAQFAENGCPGGSIYGKATAATPMLDQPLSGPVYLRASSGPLPDLVVDLDGQVHLTLVGHIDSVKGRLRTTVEAFPDIPISRFALTLQGGKRSLLVNGRNICKAGEKASVQMDGQNGSTFDTRPTLTAGCRKAKSSAISRARVSQDSAPSSACGTGAEGAPGCAPKSGPARGIVSLSSAPSSSDACPNEQFRLGRPSAGLPDCRAYEQASPVDKNGGSPAGALFKVQASLSGDGITSQTKGGLPGGEGAQQYPIYLSERGSTGWSTQGFLPPPRYGRRATVFAWTPDLAYSFSRVGLVESNAAEGTGEALLVRSSATHAIEPVTPYIEGATYAFAGASADDSKLFFESRARLTEDAAIGKDNLYLYEPASKTLSLVGLLPAAQGDQAPPGGSFAGPFNWWQEGDQLGGGGALGTRNGSVDGYLTQHLHAISSDGSKAFFTAGGTGQVYMREGIGGEQPETLQVSASQRSISDADGPKPAIFMGATPTGSRAFIASCEKLTNDSTAHSTEENNCQGSEQGQDLYAYDSETRQLSDLTVDHQAGDPRGAEVMGVIGASDDGSYVYFVANGDLDGIGGAERGDCRRNGAEFTYTGTCNLYLWHGGSSIFVARLDPGHGAPFDALDWQPGGEQMLSTGRVSGDGQVVVFSSQLQLTGYDNRRLGGECRYTGLSVCPQFYRYQVNKGLSCVTCDPSGAPPMGQPTLQSIEVGGTSPSHPLLNRFVSDSGNQVFFESPDKLVGADTNGDDGCPEVNRPASPVPSCQDVYEWEAPEAGSCSEASSAYSSQDEGCLYLLSTGTSPDPAFLGDASVSGNDVFIFTGEQLVPGDEDHLFDIYDAGVDGGLASQNQARPVPCEGEACQGGESVPPDAPPPGSASFQGPGSPQATRPSSRSKPRHKHRHRHKTRTHRGNKGKKH